MQSEVQSVTPPKKYDDYKEKKRSENLMTSTLRAEDAHKEQWLQMWATVFYSEVMGVVIYSS